MAEDHEQAGTDLGPGELQDEELESTSGGHKSSKGDSPVLEFTNAEPRTIGEDILGTEDFKK